MSKFLFAYRVPADYTPGSPGVTAAWRGWFEELGRRVVDRGNPVFDRTTVGNCGADTALGGYSLVEADDLESAVVLAEGCPGLHPHGGVEVGEITTLNREPATEV